MSVSQEQPWSNNLNAPKIPYYLYVAEKSRFAGVSLISIGFGILVVLFFQCMAALLSSANRKREGIRWWLVSYTVVMFSFATIILGTGLAIQLDCYIDNREYPLVEGGPLGCRAVLGTGAIGMTDALMFQLNYWLADGFLLYRCYMTFAKNLWVIAFPCLMFVASVATGVVTLTSQHSGSPNFGANVSNTSITVSLNFLLTLMIVTRLVLHGRNVRAATGSPAGLSGLYKTIATMLIESSALYAGASVIYVGLWASDSGVWYAFSPPLCVIQVIAPLLIIKRVANKTALTSDTITGRISSFRVRSQGEPTDSIVLPASGDPVRSIGEIRVGGGAETSTTHLDKI